MTPAYGVPIAPTPHPLVELLGVLLYPLGPRAVENVTVALGFLALSACGWVVYRLGSHWFGRAAGALAALLLLTRVPILSYGVRAYVDVPYLLLVLGALLVESRRPRAGAPVLALLALAGLLRPEAWAFSGLYWLYMMDWIPLPARLRDRLRTYAQAQGDRPRDDRSRSGPDTGAGPRQDGRQFLVLTLLTLSAPLVWILSDLLITGDPLWSLTNTRHTAEALGRITGIANVPEYIPRRIGEILGPPVLAGAALGGVLSLLWLRRRALVGAAAGVLAVAVFALFATVGLPINTRYAFLASAILCIFCGAGALAGRGLTGMTGGGAGGWPAEHCVLVALAAFAPSQYRSVHGQLDKLARQQSIEGDLLALVDDGAISLRCGVIGVPNHAPIPLLALYLKTSPGTSSAPRSSRSPRGSTSTRRAAKSNRTQHPRPPRSTSAGQRAAGLHRGAGQPLVAHFPALPLIGRLPRGPARAIAGHGRKATDRAPLFEAQPPDADRR